MPQSGFSGWSFYDAADSSRQKLTVLGDENSDGDIPKDGEENTSNYIYITSSANLDASKEIVSSAALVLFNMIKDTGSSNGSVKASATLRMQKDMEYVCIEGDIVTHPKINFVVPKNSGDECGSITPFGTVQETSDTAFTVSVKLSDLYSFDDWQLKNAGGTEVTLDEYFDATKTTNTQNSEATAVLKIKDGKDVDGFTISAKTKIRPQVRDTTPPSAAENAEKFYVYAGGYFIDGKRYFGGNYKTVSFKIAGGLVDAGTQG